MDFVALSFQKDLRQALGGVSADDNAVPGQIKGGLMERTGPKYLVFGFVVSGHRGAHVRAQGIERDNVPPGPDAATGWFAQLDQQARSAEPLVRVFESHGLAVFELTQAADLHPWITSHLRGQRSAIHPG